MVPDSIQVALLAARIFDSAGIRYLVGGSVASSVHGEPRSTQDVDFAIQLPPEKVEPLNRVLEGSEFFFHPEAVRGSVSKWAYFDLLHKKLFVKVDVYVRPNEGLHRSEMDRARLVRIGDGPEDKVRVASSEDTLLQKLLWFQMGDGMSDRQWRDVLGLLKRGEPPLDGSYLDRWASELGLVDLLQRARNEVRKI